MVIPRIFRKHRSVYVLFAYFVRVIIKFMVFSCKCENSVILPIG